MATEQTHCSDQKNQAEAAFTEDRKKMVQEIEARGISSSRVLSAIANVPRHCFVPQEHISQAYADHPLPIGDGQLIPEPYIIALMTEHLSLQSGEKVLELGTGSGYQAAILAELTDQVYTIEIIKPLAQRAAATLEKLGYDVHCKVGNGYYGWPEHAPFDAIIVTGALSHVPRPLIRQLKDGGRLVIALSRPGRYQRLWLIEKKGEQYQSTNLGVLILGPWPL